MKRIIAALMATCFAVSAYCDDLVSRNGQDTIRLTQDDCHAEVLPVVAQRFPTEVARFHAAYAVVDGKGWMACWALRSDRLVLLMYSDGDAGLVPLTEFQRDQGL